MAKETYNPLDDFQTYSIRYMLTLAENTESVRVLLQEDGLMGNILKAKSPGEPVQIGEHTIYPLCDTRRFSQFFVSDVSIDNVIASHPSKFMSPGLVRVTITDTCGLAFYNMLLDIMHNKIKTNMSSSIFLLTTIFTGHSPTGETYTTSVANTTLQLCDITDNNSGATTVSTLSLEFIETVGTEPPSTSATRPLYTLQGVTSVSTDGQPDTIGGMLSALEERLNTTYLEAYLQYWTAPSGQPKLGKLVQYMITVPDEWASLKLDLAAKSEYITDGFLAPNAKFSSPVKYQGFALTTDQVKTVNKYSQISLIDQSSIASAIRSILRSSSVLNGYLTGETVKDGSGVSDIIIPQITSDKTSIVVHFDIFPEYYPKQDNGSSTTKVSIQESNMLNFNYLFTGRNTNVIDFKIGYQVGALSSLQKTSTMATITDTVVESGQQMSKVVASGIARQSKDVDNTQLNMQSDPVIPVRSTQSKTNNAGIHNADLTKSEKVSASENRQSKEKILAYLNYLSYIDATVTIRGNPLLMRRFHDKEITGGLPTHPKLIANPAFPKVSKDAIQKEMKTAKDLYIAEYYRPKLKSSKTTASDLSNGPNPRIVGLYAKIDVRYPTTDFNGVQPAGLPMFSDRLLFQGIFKVLSIETNLNGSDFTQVLHMIPYMAESYRIEEGK